MTLKNIVKNNKVYFHALKNNVATYKVQTEGKWYIFPVDLHDIGTGTLLAEDKAIYFMRYIRKAMDNQMLLDLEARQGYVFSA